MKPPFLLAFVLLFAWLPSASSADGVTVSDAWARATAPGLAVGAAYLTLEGGREGDRLLAATLDGAGRVEIHESVENSGMRGMRRVDSVAVPAGARVALAPGGTHLMLLALDRPLVAGEARRLELRFERAGAILVDLHVRSATAGDDAHHEH